MRFWADQKYQSIREKTDEFVKEHTKNHILCTAISLTCSFNIIYLGDAYGFSQSVNSANQPLFSWIYHILKSILKYFRYKKQAGLWTASVPAELEKIIEVLQKTAAHKTLDNLTRFSSQHQCYSHWKTFWINSETTSVISKIKSDIILNNLISKLYACNLKKYIVKYPELPTLHWFIFLI